MKSQATAAVFIEVVQGRDSSQINPLLEAVPFVLPLFWYIRATEAVFVPIALNMMPYTILPLAESAVWTRT